MQNPLALFMFMICCDLVAKLNKFLKVNKKILLIFLSVIFSATVLFKQVNVTAIEEDIISVDLKFDITNPSFTINNSKEKIFVTANKGNFLNHNQIFLKNNVFFKSNNFTLLSDEVTYNKKNQTAVSKSNSKFKSEGTEIISEGFSITEKGDIILFNGKTLLILKQ